MVTRICMIPRDIENGIINWDISVNWLSQIHDSECV